MEGNWNHIKNLGGSVVKIQCLYHKGNGFNPSQGAYIPHAAWQKKKEKKISDNFMSQEITYKGKRNVKNTCNGVWPIYN